MKKYLLDKLLLLITTILIIIGIIFIPNLYGKRLSTILILLFGILGLERSKEVLLFPLDLIIGEKTRMCYYSSNYTWAYQYDFFTKERCDHWKFIENNKVFWLTVPIRSLKRGETYEKLLPPEKRKLIIKYYRLSKILISWEEAA